MPNAAVITGSVFEKHRPPPGSYHPERPERVRVIREEASRLAREGLVDLIEPKRVDAKEATRIHDEYYVREVIEVSREHRYLDPDTYVGPGTVEAALHALWSAWRAAELVWEKSYDVVYAAVRPPGHHAGVARAAGFCIFNNIAYAAQRLIDEKGAKRIAILDIDAHWGDGTAEIFYGRSDVLYISFHQDPRTLYPGRGFPEELGRGAGLGYTVNIMMPPYSSDEEYEKAWSEVAKPILEEYKPEVVLVSVGFDAHYRDPLTDLALTLEGYWRILHEAFQLAKKLSGRGLAVVLEGGYDLDVLRKGVEVIVSVMLEKPPVVEEEKPYVPRETRSRLERYLERIRDALKPYWECLRR